MLFDVHTISKSAIFSVENLLKSVHAKCISEIEIIWYNINTVKDRELTKPPSKD